MTGRLEKRAKVFFVMPNFAGGGAERVALTLLGRLDRKVFEPHLAVLDGKGPLRRLLPPDVVLHEIGQKRLRKALLPLLRLIRQQRPAVVFATQSYLNVALLATACLMPKATRIALRESSTPSLSLPNRRFPRFMAWAYRRYYPRCDVIFCQHRGTEKEMTDNFKVDPSRVARLPNPVPENTLRAAATPPERCPGPGLRIVAAGRLSTEKGFDRLVTLFAELPAEAHLTIYGEGPKEKILKSLIQTLNLESRVTLAGFTDSLPAALAGADACVLSSRWEGLPNVALEALAVGTPVVTTPESGGIAELAEAAAPGAVTIAPWGEDFAAALTACKVRSPTAPAPSLLPPRYAVEAVAAAFNAQLRGLVGQGDVLYEGQP